MEAALTLLPTSMVAAGLCRCVRPSQRPLGRSAAQLSQETPPARRRRCHFHSAFSPTTSTDPSPRLTDHLDRTSRSSPVRSLLTLRLRHEGLTHTQPASDRPPPAASCTSTAATRLCRVGGMYSCPPSVCRYIARDDRTRMLTPPIAPAHNGTRTRHHLTHQPAPAKAPQDSATQQSQQVSASPRPAPPSRLLSLQLLTGHEHDQHDRRHAQEHRDHRDLPPSVRPRSRIPRSRNLKNRSQITACNAMNLPNANRILR